MNPASRRAKTFAVLALCIAAAYVAYWPALGNGFYNDDAIFLNHADQILERPAALITERPLGYFRPTWSLYVTLQKAVFGLEPAGYFAVGILLHALNGFLVFSLARALALGLGGALTAALAFVAFFSHAEGTLWFAAHNSSLVCGLALAAVLQHLRAIRTGRLRDALGTALLVLATLFAKEPGVVVIAWLPLAEAFTAGFRSCFTRRSLVRYALALAPLVLYVATNARLGDAVATAGAQQELRATATFLRPERLLGAAAWLFSPIAHRRESLSPWLGVAALLAVPALSLLARRRDLLRIALLADLLLIAALAPACTTFQQQANVSRLYYFPTAGAALLLGAAFELARPRAARRALAVAFGLYLAVHVAAIGRVNALDYGPISRLQTRLAQALEPELAAQGDRTLYLLEPWLDNLTHLGEWLYLYWRVDRDRVQRAAPMERAQAAHWLARRNADPRARVLDWDDALGLVPATGVPGSRSSAQGQPRTADSGNFHPPMQMFMILPAVPNAR